MNSALDGAVFQRNYCILSNAKLTCFNKLLNSSLICLYFSAQNLFLSFLNVKMLIFYWREDKIFIIYF